MDSYYHVIHFCVWAVILGLLTGILLPKFYDTKFECTDVVALHGTDENTKTVCDNAHGVSSEYSNDMAAAPGNGNVAGGRYCQIPVEKAVFENTLTCHHLTEVKTKAVQHLNASFYNGDKMMDVAQEKANVCAPGGTSKSSDSITGAQVASVLREVPNNNNFVASTICHAFAQTMHDQNNIAMNNSMPGKVTALSTGKSVLSTGRDFLMCMSDRQNEFHGLIPP